VKLVSVTSISVPMTFPCSFDFFINGYLIKFKVIELRFWLIATAYCQSCFVKKFLRYMKSMRMPTTFPSSLFYKHVFGEN